MYSIIYHRAGTIVKLALKCWVLRPVQQVKPLERIPLQTDFQCHGASQSCAHSPSALHFTLAVWIFPHVQAPIPSRNGLTDVCLSMDVTLGDIGLLDHRKHFTFLVPGFIQMTMRWVTATPPFTSRKYSDLPSPPGCKSLCLSHPVMNRLPLSHRWPFFSS